MGTNGADICSSVGVGAQPDATLTAGELHQFSVLAGGDDFLLADRAAYLGSVALVVDKGVAAVGAFPGGQLVGLDNDGVTASTFDLSLGKQTSLCLVIFTTIGTFDYKFRHFLFPPFYKFQSTFPNNVLT